MAYSNWGAKVWCDSNAMHQNCDVTPRQVFGQEPRYSYYLEHYTQSKDGSWLNQMYHAVAGDTQSGILVLLYKSGEPMIYIAKEDIWERVRPDLPDDFFWYESDGFEATVNGFDIRAYPSEGPEAAHCEFVDSIGRRWIAVSGYCMGEGYEDWD